MDMDYALLPRPEDLLAIYDAFVAYVRAEPGSDVSGRLGETLWLLLSAYLAEEPGAGLATAAYRLARLGLPYEAVLAALVDLHVRYGGSEFVSQSDESS